MKPGGVYNRTKSLLIVSEVEMAQTAWKRMKGLIGRSEHDFTPGKGLWILATQGIHTIGMVFPIDVAYLDSVGQIIRSYHRLAPFRVGALMLRARSVLEVPAGILASTHTEVGDVLELRLAVNDSGNNNSQRNSQIETD